MNIPPSGYLYFKSYCSYEEFVLSVALILIKKRINFPISTVLCVLSWKKSLIEKSIFSLFFRFLKNTIVPLKKKKKKKKIKKTIYLNKGETRLAFRRRAYVTGIVHRSDLHENVNAWTFSPVDNYANRDYGDKALRSINHDSQNADTSALSRYKRIGNKDENFPTHEPEMEWANIRLLNSKKYQVSKRVPILYKIIYFIPEWNYSKKSILLIKIIYYKNRNL